MSSGIFAGNDSKSHHKHFTIFLQALIRLVLIVYKCIGTIAIVFTPDGSYMALAERRDCKDHISVLACKSWNLLKVNIFTINSLC